MSIILDKSSPIPLYYQLAEQIRDQITSGSLRHGDRLPSERELVETTGISRMTVRQALAYLIRHGALFAEPGRGTFVSGPKLNYDAFHLLSFTEGMMQQGHAPSSRVLEQTVITPPSAVAIGLDLKPGETVIKVLRLRLSHATPLLLETVFIPTSACPGLERADLATQSLYALLEQTCGLRLKRARQTVESTTANEYEANLFGIRIGMGMILLEGVAYLDGDRPLEYFKAVYRGDRFKFGLESQRETWLFDSLGAPRLSVMLTA